MPPASVPFGLIAKLLHKVRKSESDLNSTEILNRKSRREASVNNWGTTLVLKIKKQ